MIRCFESTLVVRRLAGDSLEFFFLIESVFVDFLSVRRLLVRWPANYILDRRPRVGVRTTELPYAQREAKKFEKRKKN
jgi:hypothetical protein